MPHVDRIMLARISAALDADPFADPVSIAGSAISRAYARKLERELSAKFPAAPSRSQVGDRRNDDAGHPSPLAHPASSLPGRPVTPHPTEGGPALLFNRVHGSVV